MNINVKKILFNTVLYIGILSLYAIDITIGTADQPVFVLALLLLTGLYVCDVVRFSSAMWEKGRQGSGYEKVTLIESKLFKFDVHLIRYKRGVGIPPHIDPTRDGYEHHRLNIVLKKANLGGQFHIIGDSEEKGRINYFRPDTQTHAVTKVEIGSRYVLSIGWLRKKKWT